MKYLISILIFFLCLKSFSQYNLVPNPSFETYTSCPTSSGQLTLAIGWVNPTTWGTPDYFNSCAPVLSVPYCNPSGTCFQYAKTGNAYAGIWCYDKNIASTREYAQIQFISPLNNGKCYYIGFYTNLSNWCGWACNKLGVYTSTNAISLTGPTSLLNYTSQIKSFNNQIIKDTLNWHLISGIFQSAGNEKYITIGNFNTDATTDTVTVNSLSGYGAYYMLDDVFVIPIDSMPGGMPAFAGNNVTINSGDSTFIGQQISNLNCNWYIGGNLIASNTSGLYVKPVTTTTYVVQQNLCGTITSATVVVTVNTVGITPLSFGEGLGVRFYPNPSSGKIFLSKELVSDLVIKISDVTGKIIFTDKFIGAKKDLELDLENGIYFIVFQNKEIGGSVTKKIIITK